ncbi:ABC transporter substrate-binding protein [Candidatus Poribacteria bacterium]|nr:ABC transporter substrate-binding protein [Candidatus Poribacteria bacterium]MYH80721.1 ABC transporter substrate-binding protein [Candidatus Poribacteria bacterium]
MNVKIFRLMLCVFFSLSVALLSGCERMRDMGMTDEMVTPSDETTMPTLKVGLIHPYPNYTSFGKGAELAQAEINAAGGVLGMQVEFVYKEEVTATVAQDATELAESEGVVAILGPLFSSHAVKVGPVINIPVLLGATRAEVTADATDPNDFMFLIAGSNVLQAELLAKVVVNQLEKKTAAMIWLDKDVYSEGFVESFGASFEKLGGSIVEKQVYQGGDTMFETQLTAIQAAAPDILLLASFPEAVPRIMEQARDMGIKSTFIGSDGWDDPLMSTTLADNELVDGYYCTNLDPDAVDFISAYGAEYGAVDGIAATGYDAMRILKMAIETVGSTDDSGAIRDAIANITNYEGATTISRFDENRNPVKSVGVRQMLNGMPQPDIIEATHEGGATE